MHQLAQLNIAKLKFPLDHPNTSEFVANLDRINLLAEKSKGFLWRLKDETGNASSLRFSNDPLIIPNMSVWESVEDLMEFAYKSHHTNIMKKRALWFEKINPYMVLWWVKPGHYPTLAEAKERLQHLEDHGSSAHSFDFKTGFNALGQPIK